MKIAFLDPSRQQYNAQTPYERPLGGTQSAACYLASALAERGHEVSLIANAPEAGRWRGVDCPGPAASTQSILNRQDAVVVLSDPIGAKLAGLGFSAPRVLWQHNDAAHEGVAGLAKPEERAAWAGVAYVSDYQRRRFVAKFDLDGRVLTNAVSPSVLLQQPAQTFVERGDGPELIYASSPGRGLDLLLIAFPTIRAAIPNARLLIFSDLGVYQRGGQGDDYRVFYQLAQALEGVEYVGSVGQAHLAEALQRADVLAYPTNFIETSCIVAIDAAASGVLLAVSDFGALPETAAGFGSLTPLKPKRAEFISLYAQTVIAAIRQAMADPAEFNRRRQAQIEAFRANTWERRAQEWEAWLSALTA